MTDTRERQISDLLAYRDGGLTGTEAGELLSRPGAAATLSRLEQIRRRLLTLEDPAPDPAGWARVQQAVAARRDPAVAPVPGASARFRPVGRFVPYAAAAGLVLALSAALLGMNTLRSGGLGPAPVEVMRAGAAGVGRVPMAEEDPLRALHERSRRLEPLLTSADPGDRTAQALRLRIADLDAQIAESDDRLPDRQQAQRLWGQRVALLESLAEVRRARATLQPAVY